MFVYNYARTICDDATEEPRDGGGMAAIEGGKEFDADSARSPCDPFRIGVVVRPAALIVVDCHVDFPVAAVVKRHI